MEFTGTGLPLGSTGRDGDLHTEGLQPGDLAVFYTDDLIDSAGGASDDVAIMTIRRQAS